MKLNWSVKNSKIVWQGRFPVIEDLLESDHDGREHLYTYLGIDSTAGTNNTFKRVLGQSGIIEDWNCYGHGTASWGLGVLYDDGRVDACGDNNSYGETGTQTGNLHDVKTLKNVIF